jgi:hypothetical protein
MVALSGRTLYVGFGVHRVAVHSSAPEALAGLARSFREMLVPESTRTVGHLEVHRREGRYHLLGDCGGSVESGSLADTLHGLKYTVVRYLIHARPELMWLHAGAATCRGSAVMIVGPWGHGKSTLVASLYAKGWGYLSDDLAPLVPGSGRVLPFPLTPAVREAPGHEMPRCRIPELRKIEVDLKPGTVCQEAAAIGTLVFPTYNHRSPTVISPYSPAAAALELLRNCVNFTSHREGAVRYLCGLANRLPTFRLTFGNAKLAAKLIAQVHENGHPA